MDPHTTPAPCGIVCRTCRHLNEGCAGCYDGGGDEACHVRACTAQEDMAGCWACETFPCQGVRDIDPAWRGLTIGLVRSVIALGEARYAELALRSIGEYAEYGDLRFKTPEEIEALVRGAAQGGEGGEGEEEEA
jgi:hypothetical protein